MSYLEIYNENIRDLLDPSTGYLELRDESRGKNIQVNICWKHFWTKNACSYSWCFPHNRAQEVNAYLFLCEQLNWFGLFVHRIQTALKS